MALAVLLALWSSKEGLAAVFMLIVLAMPLYPLLEDLVGAPTIASLLAPVRRLGPLTLRNFLADILEFATQRVSLHHERQNRPPPLL